MQAKTRDGYSSNAPIVVDAPRQLDDCGLARFACHGNSAHWCSGLLRVCGRSQGGCEERDCKFRLDVHERSIVANGVVGKDGMAAWHNSRHMISTELANAREFLAKSPDIVAPGFGNVQNVPPTMPTNTWSREPGLNQ